MKTKKIVLVLGFVAALAGTAEASVIYDEGSSGDLGNSIASSTNIGTLATGENLIVGTLNANDGSDLQDSIKFTTLSNWVLNIDALTIGTGGDGFGAVLYDEFVSFVGGQIVSSAPSLNVLGTQAPGTYFLALVPSNGTTELGGEVTYTIDLQTVPEPATLVLFGLGFAGVPFIRRRRTPA